MADATTIDLYEVTMAMSYLREGMSGPATFSLFVRDLPPERGFLVAAGLESALDHLSGLCFGPEDVDAFASALHRSPRDLQSLLGLEFTGDVRAVPEGRIVLAGEPLRACRNADHREWWSRRVRRGRLGPLRRADRHLRRRHPPRRLGPRPVPGVDKDQITVEVVEGELTNGVLTVRVPKTERGKPQRVEITG